MRRSSPAAKPQIDVSGWTFEKKNVFVVFASFLSNFLAAQVGITPATELQLNQ